MGKLLYNWDDILQRIRFFVSENPDIPVSWTALSKETEIPRKTLQEGLSREFGIETSDLENLRHESMNNREKVKITETEDGILAESNSRRIKTLEDLIEECNIDLDVWYIERWVANKWEVGAKNSDKELVIKPLFQIKAWLRPISELEEDKKIQPVKIQVSISGEIYKKKKSARKTEITLILPDIHLGFDRNIYTNNLSPYHDRLALDVVGKLIQAENFDRIIFLGDTLDLSDFSTHFARNPEVYWTTQPAIYEAAWWLTRYKYFAQDSQIDMLEGNHDERLARFISEKAGPMYHLKAADEADKPSIMTIERLLSLQSIGITYHSDYPNGTVWLNNSIRCIHGRLARKKPGGTARALIDSSHVSTIQGHVHRMEMVTKTVYTRHSANVIYAISPGCLCRVDGVVPGSTNTEQWQQGVTVIEYSADELLNVTHVPIFDGFLTYHGSTYIGEDLSNQISKDINWDVIDKEGHI